MNKLKSIYLLAFLTIGILTIYSCNKDDDCTEQTWYKDTDGDGFGNASVSQQSCSQPNGYVLDNTDCADNDPNSYPGAPENTSDGIDNNCNGDTDECVQNIQTTTECDCNDGIDNDSDGDIDDTDTDCDD